MIVSATEIPHTAMHWKADSFQEYITAKYGLKISGMPAGYKLWHPSKIRGLDTLQRLIRMWRNGTIHFDKLDRGKFDWVRAEYEIVRSKRCAERGSMVAEKKRRDQRGVMTVGATGKGQLKSTEFILDSETD